MLLKVSVRTYFNSYCEIRGRWYWNKVSQRIIEIESKSRIAKILMNKRIYHYADDNIKTSYSRRFDPLDLAPLAPRATAQQVRGVSIE